MADVSPDLDLGRPFGIDPGELSPLIRSILAGRVRSAPPQAPDKHHRLPGPSSSVRVRAARPHLRLHPCRPPPLRIRTPASTTKPLLHERPLLLRPATSSRTHQQLRTSGPSSSAPSRAAMAAPHRLLLIDPPPDRTTRSAQAPPTSWLQLLPPRPCPRPCSSRPRASGSSGTHPQVLAHHADRVRRIQLRPGSALLGRLCNRHGRLRPRSSGWPQPAPARARALLLGPAGHSGNHQIGRREPAKKKDGAGRADCEIIVIKNRPAGREALAPFGC